MSFLSQPIQDILIRAGRSIGDIKGYTVINETTNDTLTITKQPVQQGASITDHAYKEPTSFSTNIYLADNQSLLFTNPFSSTNPLATLYKKLLDLQNSRETFEVVTPKRKYPSMLIASLTMTTDKNTENCLAINATLQEVIIVNISTVAISRDKQILSQATAKTENAGRKSAFLSIKEGIFGQ